MDKMHRLRSNMEFKKVYSGGKTYWNRNLVLYVRRNNFEYNRVGYSITKKIGNSIVRNKIRRRMKEIYRLNFYELKGNYDLILDRKSTRLNSSH